MRIEDKSLDIFKHNVEFKAKSLGRLYVLVGGASLFQH